LGCLKTVEGKVTGILGPNGVGKSTAVNILSGNMIPNLGGTSTTWEEVLEIYSGTGMYDYMKALMEGNVSGGELQRVALAACVCRDADFYFIDEVSPYLDIYQRINAARIIQELADTSAVMVVEHDLALLDLLADTVHIVYGVPGEGMGSLPTQKVSGWASTST